LKFIGGPDGLRRIHTPVVQISGLFLSLIGLPNRARCPEDFEYWFDRTGAISNLIIDILTRENWDVDTTALQMAVCEWTLDNSNKNLVMGSNQSMLSV